MATRRRSARLSTLLPHWQDDGVEAGLPMLKLMPPVWFAIYLALAGAVSAAFPWRTIVDLRILGLGLFLLLDGFALSFSAFMLFRRDDTEINPTSETNRTLIVRGPYRLTRNPMYLGLVLISLGIALCVGSLPMFLVPICMFGTTNWVHIPFEEAKMRRQFGDSFDRYTRSTRRWI
jgi:protein-S-isoprenylcysteine O-methyltransferase Ste14